MYILENKPQTTNDVHIEKKKKKYRRCGDENTFKY